MVVYSASGLFCTVERYKISIKVKKNTATATMQLFVSADELLSIGHVDRDISISQSNITRYCIHQVNDKGWA